MGFKDFFISKDTKELIRKGEELRKRTDELCAIAERSIEPISISPEKQKRIEGNVESLIKYFEEA